MHATDELRADRDVLLAAIRQDVQAAVFVPPDLKEIDEITDEMAESCLLLFDGMHR